MYVINYCLMQKMCILHIINRGRVGKIDSQVVLILGSGQVPFTKLKSVKIDNRQLF